MWFRNAYASHEWFTSVDKEELVSEIFQLDRLALPVMELHWKKLRKWIVFKQWQICGSKSILCLELIVADCTARVFYLHCLSCNDVNFCHKFTLQSRVFRLNNTFYSIRPTFGCYDGNKILFDLIFRAGFPITATTATINIISTQ